MASSSSTSLSLSLVKKDEVTINWAELPPELTSAIMLRLSAIEKLDRAQRVCTSWLRVCKDPSMWRKIDMLRTKTLFYSPSIIKLQNLGSRFRYNYLEAMSRRAVDLSQGGLLEIKIQYFGTNELLTYIADRSSNLRSLELVNCEKITNFGISKIVVKLPLLEELSLTFSSPDELPLKTVGQACPNLKILKLHLRACRLAWRKCDDDALAIAETMPGLYHLELLGNRLSDIGLNAILDNCPHLEHLDLCGCMYINLVGDLEKRCLERIKHVIHPYDATAGRYYSDSDDYEYDDYEYGSDYSVDCGVYLTSDDDMY